MSSPTPTRLTLRDLPLPAKLVVTCFLISVGLGYLWAMAQIHFRHATPGKPMPSLEDLVSRFSGVPWPLEPRPEPDVKTKGGDDLGAADAIGVHADGVKIKTIIDSRCVVCHKRGGKEAGHPLSTYEEIAKYLKPTPAHKKGRLLTMLTGPRGELDNKSMASAFFEDSEGWDKLTAEEQKKEEPRRETERRAVIAWIEAGAPKAHYEADRFPLPAGFNGNDLPARLQTKAPTLAPGAVATTPTVNPAREKTAAERWNEAKSRQLDMVPLTQSTHAHLLTFSLLWAATGIVFAFTTYSYTLRCVVAPVVLVAQVLDVACWWLARLEPPTGPYFALAIMGTGAVVGLGLAAQIILSLFNMYGRKGKVVLAVLFLTAAGLFGLAYVKVIEPQLQSERDFVAKQAK